MILFYKQGVFVGDCLGRLLGSDLPPDYLEILDNFQKNKRFQYTNDTALTKAVCESLIQSEGLDMSNLAEALVTKYENEPNRGYAAGAVSIFEELRKYKSKNNLDEKCLKPSLNLFFGSGSFGNGCGMRICPIGLLTSKNPLKEMVIIAILATSLTHSHYFSLIGGVLQCCVVRRASKCNIEEFKNDKTAFLNQYLHDIIEFIKLVEKDLLIVIREALDGKFPDFCKDMKFYLYWLEKHIEKQLKLEKPTIDKNAYSKRLEKLRYLFNECQKGKIIERGEFHKYYAKCNITALESIPVAFFAFLVASDPKCENEVNSKLHTKNSFEKYDHLERTILYAVSLGGDTNTIASMAGAISGAFYGAFTNSNSKKLIKYCEEFNVMYSHGEELFKLVYCNNYCNNNCNTCSLQQN